MTQYLLSVHTVEGKPREPMSDEEMRLLAEHGYPAVSPRSPEEPSRRESHRPGRS